MKYIFLSLLFFSISPYFSFGQVDFDRFFKDETMRIDYYHTGNSKHESAQIDSIYAYGTWAGSKTNTISEFHYGKSFYKIIDKQSGQVIFTKSFDSYFKEYQTTDKAIAGEQKSFFESALIPHPLKSFFFILEKRDSLNNFQEVFREEINPSTDVNQFILSDDSVQVFTSLSNGLAEKKVDILIIGDGYTKDEKQKFEDDLHRATINFFEVEPLKSNRDKFNVRGVFKASAESGITDPGMGRIKKTAVNSTFNALGVERYLLTEDIKAVHDIAAYAPSDAIVIMVNSSKYGGGGIFNFYCTFTSENPSSAFVMVHEFGHSFFGLGDEYYSSSTAYNSFYPEGTEPLAPNIAANTNKSNIKWKDLLSDSIEIPTPWQKAAYDSSQKAWQAESSILLNELETLKRKEASTLEIAARQSVYDRKSLAQQSLIQSILSDSRYAGKVGAFEGAGYESVGLYRPALTCIMFTQENHFCPVCDNSMIKMIKWYTETP